MVRDTGIWRARRFKRSFGLADGVEVRRAELHDELLYAMELKRSAKDATIKTVRMTDGETAKPETSAYLVEDEVNRDIRV